MTITDDAVAMTPADQYRNDLLFVADRIADAARTEDRSTIAAVLADALAMVAPAPTEAPCACAVPRLDPAHVTALLLALAVQIPEWPVMRDRIEWTFDIAALNPGKPEHPISSSAYKHAMTSQGTEYAA